MDDSRLNTKAKESDFFCVNEQGQRYLFRLDEQPTPIRYYESNRIFLKYRKRCPLFRDPVASASKEIIQYLLDCSEKRDYLTCKNMFKCISKNKVKGIKGHNSCHECDHFYEGLDPKWESYAQSLLHQTNRQEPKWMPPTENSPRFGGYTEADFVVGLWRPHTNPKIAYWDAMNIKHHINFNVLKNRAFFEERSLIEMRFTPSLRIVDG